MVNKTRIRDALAKLESQLKSLREKQTVSLEEYKRNRDLQAIVERRLYIAIQVSIDIAMHIVSENGPRKPESYSDVFVVLSEMGVIDSAISKRMEEEAGFRNVLAHEYADIIDREVYRHLQQLDIFEAFAQQINECY
ncbi:MAG: DUF86 domain-containing protein [Candidatus Korarchaeota archaeon]|nr:DUF86 domain-containing protein [Candidatus Korarchaeota archaeon]NIU84060.1 DUF86 domain-containing protein [Candidatus Thorarchaeota archaeon]NIW12775.1 DUF86 domain-containing protein [Candidatus Thorarchaeota archaeon]NIW50982.1 DUF86 domain-containing protein [Candidatus Korarchaeota archaeon]